MMRLLLLSILLILRHLESAPSRDHRGEVTENFTSSQLSVRLSLSERSFKEGDRVPLTVQISNLGIEPVRFFPSNLSHETYQIFLEDKDHRLVAAKEESFPFSGLKRRNHIEDIAGIHKKEVILHKGEHFSRTFYLDELFQIRGPGEYLAKVFFFPNAKESKDFFLRSENQPIFFLEPRGRSRELSQSLSPMGDEVGVTPEEVIFLFLGSELKKNWESHFKWIDFSEYILSYDKYSASYSNANPGEKSLILEDFRKFLSEGPSGQLKFYKVLSVDYPSSKDAKVQVYIERSMQRYTQRYEYTYTLKKIENATQWKIQNLYVKVRK